MCTLKSHKQWTVISIPKMPSPPQTTEKFWFLRTTIKWKGQRPLPNIAEATPHAVLTRVLFLQEGGGG